MNKNDSTTCHHITINMNNKKDTQVHDMTGYVQIYTGNGKGKTTAALGLALRAIGAGLKVYFCQFLKQGEYCEITSLRKRFPDIPVKQYGSGDFITGVPSKHDIEIAQCGFAEIREAIISGNYDVVILDEVCVAVNLGLLLEDDLISLIDTKPDHVELVFTGRGASKRLIEKADLVTEMHAVKHYLDSDVDGRPGIER